MGTILGSGAWARWLIPPLVGGFIGWMTNVLAIRMLFYPRRPWRVPVVGWVIQGVLPRRQGELARQLGEVIASELLRSDDLVARLVTPATRAELAASVAARAEERVRGWLPGFLPGSWREGLLEIVRERVREEGDRLLTEVLQDWAQGLGERVDVAGIVENRVREFDLEKLERVIVQLSHRELRAIELMGGLLGVLIGLGQVLLTLVLGAH